MKPARAEELIDPASGRPFQPPEGFDRNPAQSLSIYKWWRQRMGAKWMATPETYGLGAIEADPMLPLGERLEKGAFKQKVTEITGGKLRNFEGVDIPIDDEVLDKLAGRKEKHPYLSHFIDTVKRPREVWATPGEKVRMRYMKAFGESDFMAVVDVGEEGIRDVDLVTYLSATKSGKPWKGYLDGWRNGVLVHVRQ